MNAHTTAAAKAVDSIIASTAPAGARPTDDGFDAELAVILKQSLDARKPLVFHLGGTEISGVVKEIRPGTIIVSNHEHPRILVRLARVVAVESN